MRTARDHFDVTRSGAAYMRRARRTHAIDQVFSNLLIGRAVTEPRGKRLPTRETRRRNMRATRRELTQHVRTVGYRLNVEAHTECGCEFASEIELRALRSGRAEVIGTRQIACNHAQFPTTQDLLQHARRLRTSRKEETGSDGEDGFQTR